MGQTLKVAVHKEMFPNTLRDLGLSTRMWFKGCMVSSKPIDGSLPKYLFVVSLHLFLLQAANSIRNAIVKEEVLEPGDCFPKVAPMSPRGGGPGSPKPQPKEVGDEGETQPGSPDELKSKSKDQEFQHMERSSDTHTNMLQKVQLGLKKLNSRVVCPEWMPPQFTHLVPALYRWINLGMWSVVVTRDLPTHRRRLRCWQVSSHHGQVLLDHLRQIPLTSPMS